MNASINSHNNAASFTCADASIDLINMVPLGQCTKKLRREVPTLPIVEICTLGGVSHVFLSSLAHVERFSHFVPSTFVYLYLDFG
jgi:hypothetical protein